MATLTGKLVADTYKALLKMIDNDVVTATEKQISDGLGGGTGIFIDQDGEIRASKYRVTGGTSSQFLKADGSLDSTSYLPSGTTTTSIPEGSNLYFTNSRVLNTTLNGFTAVSGTVTSADSVLTAIEKIWWNIINGGGGGGGGYVPYVGATQNLNLGEYGLLAGFVRFDTTPTTLAGTQGELFWDEDHSTIAIQMNSAKCVIGQDVYFYVKNQSGSTIPKGTAVGFAGTLGASGRLLIAPFLADGSQPSKYFMGLVAEDIANGDDGFVLEFGQIRQINTTAYNDGDILYVSPTVAGGLTTTIPEAPNNIITIAAVVHSASNGVLQVRATLGSRLNEDELVYLDNLADKDALFYNNTTGRFENKDIYGTEGYLPIYDDIDILKDSIIYSDGVGIGVGTNILEPTAIATFFGNVDLVTGTYLTSDGFNLIGRGNLINQIEIGSQNASDYLTFIAGNAERARITATGNFGIGLTNPSAPLHVKGSTYTNVIVDNNSATGGGSYLSYQNGTKKALFGLSGAFELNTGSDVAIASTIAGGGIKFYTNNSTTQAMGIVSSGNAYLGQAPTFLGLGTEFIVRGQASDGVLGVMDSTEVVKGLFISNSSLSWIGTYSNHPLAFRTNNTEWARISSAGNLLIGTIVDNATDKLQVNGTSYFADNIVLADSKGIISSGVNMLSRNNLNNQIIIGADGGINDNVAFYAGDLERMRLLANGRLAINKTTASYQVDVQGDVNVSGAFRVNGTIIPNGTVTSVAMSVPTGLVISGSPITSSGTLAVTYAVNYGIPTLTKQSDWDDAYTWVTNFPDQSSNAGKFLTTNGSVLSWASLVTGVSSVFGRTGAVTAQSGDYTTAQVTESGNLYYTDARARLALSASAPLSYNNGTGAFSISQASGSTNGFLSSTDWNTFNNKQNALGYTPVPTTRTLTINGTSYDLSADRSWTISAGLSGSGTTNYVSKFTGSTSIGNSLIFDNGSGIGIGTTTINGSGTVLSIYNATDSQIRLQSGVSGQLASDGALISLASDNSMYVYNYENAALNFGTNNSIRMTLNASGNLGIGSTNPDEILTLNRASSLYARIVNTSNSVSTYWGVNGTEIYFGSSSNSPVTFYSNSTERMRIDASGNLLVATNTASYPSSGRGNITIGGSSTSVLSFQNNGTGKGFLYHGGTNFELYNNANGFLGFGTNGSETMRINAGGNVSIGNTNNTYKLDVSGNANFSGVVQDTIQTVMRLSGKNSSNQVKALDFKVTAGTPLWTISTAADGTDSGINIMPNGTSGLSLSYTGIATFSSNVTAASINTIGVNSNNSSFDANYTSDYTVLRSAVSGTRSWQVDNVGGQFRLYMQGTSNSYVFNVSTSGNVGIGTTSPSTLLEVAGITSIKSGYFGGGYLKLNYTSSDAGSRSWAIANDFYYTGDFGIYQSSTQTGTTWGIPKFYISSSGNVGIGTPSPVYKFVVSNNGGQGMEFDTGTIIAGRNYIINYNRSSGVYNDFEIAANNIVFSTIGPERMRITSGGNVGIGSTSPAYKLDVSGTIRGLGSIIDGANNGNTSRLNFTRTDFSWGIYNETNLRIYTGSGNTLSPSTKVFELATNGAATFSSSVTATTFSATDATGSAILTTNGGGEGVLSVNTANPLRFFTNGTERMRITSGGLVGIGTSSPSVSILHLNYNSVNNRALRLQDQNGIFDIITSGASQNHSFGLYDDTNGAYRLFVLNNGNVGIGTTSPNQKLSIDSGTSTASYLQFTAGSTTGTASTDGFHIGIDSAGKAIINQRENLSFGISTNNTERVLINNSGIITITGNMRFYYAHSPAYVIQLPNDLNDGQAIAYAWVAYSDARVKKNVSELNYGIDSIMKLKPVSYNHHSARNNQGKIDILEKYKYEIGFIAQEVYNVIPEVVNPGNDLELWGMNYERLTSVIVKGMQEQQVMIETNAEKIARLEKEVSFLKTKIA